MPRASASATTARETGCSEPKPHAAATASSVSSETPVAGRISRRPSGAPTVTVPVLSRISVSTSDARSRKSALLIRMRRRVARRSSRRRWRPGPATTSAVGVATTSTAIARDRSSREEQRRRRERQHERQPDAGAPLEEAQHGHASRAPLRRAAARRGRAPCRRRRRAPGSAAARRARRCRRRPGCRARRPRGSDSPVIADWSTAARPSSTVPSTAIRSPGPDEDLVARQQAVRDRRAPRRRRAT